MGLFSFLSPKVENPKKTIFDLFLINIKELPDSSFIDEGYATNSMGSEFQFFTSDLDYLECGIFNKIEILKFTEGGMNVTFKSGISTTLNITKLKDLVNSLFQIYGNDSDGRGKFTNQDINEYYGVFDSFRRNWMKKTPVININAYRDDNDTSGHELRQSGVFVININAYRDDNDISLSILGIENNFANNEKLKKSINDFLKTNLKELPDKRFNANGFVSSEKVAGFYSFDLTLDYLECGIFNEINVHQHPEGGMTVFFYIYRFVKC